MTDRIEGEPVARSGFPTASETAGAAPWAALDGVVDVKGDLADRKYRSANKANRFPTPDARPMPLTEFIAIYYRRPLSEHFCLFVVFRDIRRSIHYTIRGARTSHTTG